MPAVVIQCTCPDDATAVRISTALVAERLAACVQRVAGVQATYRWNGVVEQAAEVLLLIKTASERIPAVFARVQALHPYDVPELIALDVQHASPSYLDWVLAQSSDDA